MYYNIEYPDGSFLREYTINKFGTTIDYTDYQIFAAIVTKEQAELIIQQFGEGKIKEIK